MTQPDLNPPPPSPDVATGGADDVDPHARVAGQVRRVTQVVTRPIEVFILEWYRWMPEEREA